MFKPSYLSAQGPHGAYGADEVTPPAESTSEKTTWGTRLTNTQATITTAQDTLTTVQETADSAKGLWDMITASFKKKPKKKTTPPPSVFDKAKAAMTPDEYARFLVGVKSTCGSAPKITSSKSGAYLACASKQADAVLAARNKTQTSFGQNTTDQGTEKKDYTWYYVGGAAGVLALGAAAWYFGIYRPKHK